MPDTRALPIPAEHREFTVKVEGEEVAREHQLLSVSIGKTANRIAWARLCFLDGAAAASDFPLSNAELFVPARGSRCSPAQAARPNRCSRVSSCATPCACATTAPRN